jgi:hypothetical protein
MIYVLPAKASGVSSAHPMTLLEELQARIQAKSASSRLPSSAVAPITAANTRSTEASSPSKQPIAVAGPVK